MRKNKSVRLLSLRSNGIDDLGAAQLGKALRENTVLEGLS